MAITVHHQPLNLAHSYNLHLWNDLSPVDLPGTLVGSRIDFTLPSLADARNSRFKFRSTDPVSHQVTWESDSFVRQFRLAAPTDAWTFESSPRILYIDPAPAGATFHTGDVLTFNLVTQQRFVGGRLYVWNPYDPTQPSQSFTETSRAGGVSVFRVSLGSWMTAGFHFKFVGKNGDGSDYWEPDSANRVWRPADGSSLWLKGNQVNVRHSPLTLTTHVIEALFPSSLTTPPVLNLYDQADDYNQPLTPTVAPYAGSGLFQVGIYSGSIYPDAAYTLSVDKIEGNQPFVHPFPSPHATGAAPSRLIVGSNDWVAQFPLVITSQMLIEPRPGSGCFSAGLSVQISTQLGPVHETVAAATVGGNYQATINALQGVQNAIWLQPLSGPESELYAWIDKSRYFVPQAAGEVYFTAEGVFGLSSQSTPDFAEPPIPRQSLMAAAFGNAIANGGVFAAHEMPHGATLVGGDVYFAIHAPHAVTASLVLIDETAVGGPQRRAPTAMHLTADTRYWWCKVPVGLAPPETRYRFLLNERDEVMDPAARAVYDSGEFNTQLQDDPSKSWSKILDVAAVRAAAHQAPWKTMGWESLVIYEMHGKRFTDRGPAAQTPLDRVAAELGAGRYLNKLPVTALELLPVNEFKSTNSWGYNTACYFAIDGDYGGAAALARLVNAAHAAGRAVMLDLVYNHSQDSPLMKVARDVYRNGDAWGDRMNSGHPMVQEFLRQAVVYHLATFGFDGFRFDDTKTILRNVGGWDFLAIIRAAVRSAASALGQPWPYCVAENELGDQAGEKTWDISNPAWSIVDGVWHIDEVYKIRDATYDTKNNGDSSSSVAQQMAIPQSWYRPFHEAVRYGESHDMVSGQDTANQRIAARPRYREGFQMSKAIAALVLLSNGAPMLFMGQEFGDTRPFSLDFNGMMINPQDIDLPAGTATDQTRVLQWFRELLGLRNDGYKGLRGDSNVISVRRGHRTIAFSCGYGGSLFCVVTVGTANQHQDSSWLGLPAGGAFKEIFNSSWPAFQVEFEAEQTNGGYDAQIQSGAILNLPYIGAVVLERR
jgi:1,4-alpha-glucan branching enzyme